MKNNVIILIAALIISTSTFAQKISADKVPAAVSSALKAKFPGASKIKWEMENEKEFEAAFTLNGNEASANFDKDGNWVETETEMEFAKTPAAVQKTVNNEFAGYKIKETSQIETPDKGTFYEVEIEKDKVLNAIKISADGEVMEKSVVKDKED